MQRNDHHPSSSLFAELGSSVFATVVAGLLFALPAPAHAYVTATFNRGPYLDARVPTHFVVAGTSDRESNLFVQSAVTRARRYVQLYPDHQVVLLSTRDRQNGDLSTDRYSGLTITYSDNQSLSTDVLVKYLTNFKHIRSLDFYGHGVLDRGFNIDDGHHLLPNSRGIETLREHFDPEAYATFHACNSGFVLAPAFSRLWNIPVAGMLTGTDFQVLHTDGNWYFNNEGAAPKGVYPSRVNELSYSRPVSCRDGGCVRMLPNNATYKGKLGNFQAGLGFMKFFCSREVGPITGFFKRVGFAFGFRKNLLDEKRCQKNMALALISEPTNANSSLNDYNSFTRAALDFICPVSAKGRNVACRRALLDSTVSQNKVYSSLRRPDGESVLQCSFEDCDFGYTREGKSFNVYAPAVSAPTTQIEEFWNYLYGFQHLSKSRSRR